MYPGKTHGNVSSGLPPMSDAVSHSHAVTLQNISSLCLGSSPEHASSVHIWFLPCQTTVSGNSTLLQVPLVGYRAAPPSPAAAMLYTGEDQTISTALANNLFVQSALSPSTLAAPIANFQAQAAQVALCNALFVKWPPYTVAFCTSCWVFSPLPPINPMNVLLSSLLD